MGSAWGDILLQSKRLRDTRLARSLSYCEVAKLTRDHLFSVAEEHPESLKILREAALKLATWRSVLIISAFVRVRRGGANSRANSPSPAPTRLLPPQAAPRPQKASVARVARPSRASSSGSRWTTTCSIAHGELFSASDEPMPFRTINEEGAVEVTEPVEEEDDELIADRMSGGVSFKTSSAAASSFTSVANGGKSFSKGASKSFKRKGEDAVVLKELKELKEMRMAELRELREMRSEFRRGTRAREEYARDLKSLRDRLQSDEERPIGDPLH